jgi:transposase
MHRTDALLDLPPLPRPEQLPDDSATLKGMLLEVLATLHERQRDYEALQHRVDQLLRRLYGPRSERYDPQQPWLFPELAAGAGAGAAAAAAPAAAPTAQRRCRPHGRRRLPEHLPREPRHHTLPEAARLCPGCGQLRADIGVDKSEQLDYRPASLRVIEHFVHKYACPRCRQAGPAAPGQQPQDPEPPRMPSPDPAPQPVPPAELAQTPAPGDVVIAAAKPAPPIAKGLPGAGLLAHLIVSKYVDHLPLYRLERHYERQGVFLPRSTLCDWLGACAGLLRPLYERLIAVLLQSRALHTDDTPIKLQDPVTHTLRTARLWVYLGDAAHPYNVFDFTPTRQRDGPQHFLANFQGSLQADAFSGYDRLYLPEPGTAAARIREVACNAHARRKFYEARGSDALRSHQALAYYRQLYELERAAQRNGFDEAQTLQMRQDLAVPILNQFQAWLAAARAEVLPKSPLGEAFGYILHNWSALSRYTEAGFLTIDNNVAEREMKRIAIGRKNWLFVGSLPGGQTTAVLFSFTSTCQRLGVEPWSYLQDILTRLPTTQPEQLGDLLPDHWQAARAATPVPTKPGLPPSAESLP